MIIWDVSKENQVSAYAETKAQLSSTVIAADKRFCFPTKIVLSVMMKIELCGSIHYKVKV